MWFPCVDMLSEICTWAIEVTVPADMLVVTCGQLMEQVSILNLVPTSVYWVTIIGCKTVFLFCFVFVF